MSPTVTTVVPAPRTSPGVGGFHQHHAVDGRGGHGVGELRIDQGDLRFGALDLGLPGDDLLLAALQLDLVRLAEPERGARARHLGAGGLDGLGARPGFDEREPLLGLLQARRRRFERVRNWSYCAVEMSSFL